MDPFQALLPELCQLIYDRLTTPWDARNQVALQRTCKAANRLRPGLIWAPRWSAFIAYLNRNQAPVVQWTVLSRVYTLMAAVFKELLFDKPWFVVPHVTLRHGTTSAIWMEWPLGTVNNTVLTAILEYKQERASDPWRCAVQVSEGERNGPMNTIVQRVAVTLHDLLVKVPFLHFGVSPERLHRWSTLGKLDLIFQ